MLLHNFYHATKLSRHMVQFFKSYATRFPNRALLYFLQLCCMNAKSWSINSCQCTAVLCGGHDLILVQISFFFELTDLSSCFWLTTLCTKTKPLTGMSLSQSLSHVCLHDLLHLQRTLLHASFCRGTECMINSQVWHRSNRFTSWHRNTSNNQSYARLSACVQELQQHRLLIWPAMPPLLLQRAPTAMLTKHLQSRPQMSP